MPHPLLLLALLLVATPGARAAAEPPDAGDELVSVIVKLADAPLARYAGGVPGLGATRAAALGATRLDPRSARSRAYLAHLDARLAAFERTAGAALRRTRLVHRYRVVFGGVSMIVPASEVPRLAALPGVVAVHPDRAESVTTERSPKLIGAPALWRALGGSKRAGEGVIVGILDTGIWPEHPSFADPDPLGRPYPPPPPGWKGGEAEHCPNPTPGSAPGTCCELPKDGSAPLVCTNKLIGARRFLDTYTATFSLLPGEFDSARDSEGHGTHVASTAAGNAGVAATVLGVPRGKTSGIAPRAHVVMYRVCGHPPEGGGGCLLSDSMAAIEQAILDGVDVLNFSIGGGSDPYTDVVSQAFLDAYEAGIFVAASAGNDGPDPNTVNHRGGWMTTVGATTPNRGFVGTAVLKSDAPRGKLKLAGASLTSGIGDATPVVWAGDFGDASCLMPFATGTFGGAIVACERGVIARVAKGANVAAGGAGGLLLYNPTLQGVSSDNHFLPALHLEAGLGQALVEFLTNHGGVTGTLKAGKAKRAQADVLAALSSRGGSGQTLGIAKPDVTAPGVQILAGHTPVPHGTDGGMPGELFQAIQGTSMASPHVAGAAALLRDLRPDWTPGQIKSALMTTARTKKLLDDDATTPADPFDAGSGRVDLKAALKAGVTIDATAQDYVDHELTLWHVNYPSLYVPQMPATLFVARTLENVSGKKLKLAFKVEAPPDLGVLVTPAKLVLAPGAAEVLEIVLDASTVPAGSVWHAHLRAKNFHFPITIVRAP